VATAQPQLEPIRIEELVSLDASARWSLSSRIAFRFTFVYLVLLCLTTQIFGAMFPIPNVNIRDLTSLAPVRAIIFWTASHVFRVTTPLVYQGSGSGDKTFDWVLAFCTLVIAAVAAAVWSIADRNRANYIALHKWFRLFLRFALASQMFSYGMAKAVPLQMPFPFLTRLLEPYGNFSPMGVLWASIGASRSYEIFAGCAEMLGGLLLIFPRTTTLGALVCLADMVQVFMLNMTYDVPVKLFSFELILMSIVLLAPEMPRLVNVLILNRTAEPSTQPQLFSGRRTNRIALAAQVAFGMFLVAMNCYGSWKSWYAYGGGRTKSPLYGIWTIDQLSSDGQLRAPNVTDNDRWRRAIFDFPTSVGFQRMDDSVTTYGATIDAQTNTIALKKGSDKNWKADFKFQRTSTSNAADKLALDGNMDGHKLHMELTLFDRNKFLLVSRGFHWIQEYPFNR
jgi:uncharacterized membrane protein YphA (DoxX/SURF4 family)